MKDEIKEILDKLDKIKTFGYNPVIINSFSYRDLYVLLDYITNLQQENERLKEINKEQANHLISKDNLSYENYKSRNEKAIEYIEECIDSEDIYEQFLSTGETQKVLNILQGEDKDE